MVTRRHFLAFLAVAPSALWGAAWAATAVRDIRHSLTPEKFRLVLEFGRKRIRYHDFLIEHPDRLVLDIKSASLPKDLVPNISNEVVHAVRVGHHRGGRLRVVLDLRRKLPHEIQVVPAADGKGERLVLDLLRPKAPLARRGPGSRPAAVARTAPRRPVAKSVAKSGAKSKMVVVIDPGHGGKDPGAVGRQRTREKDVVLAISKNLLRALRADPNITPYLTRTNDRFMHLRDRTQLARDKQAGLFVSVHADAARKRSARGASVYVLSTRGASSEQAKWLAARENSADLISPTGEVELAENPVHVRETLLDMSQNAAMEYSLDAGAQMVRALSKVGRMHSHKVERAGFAVLKSPDMPSILVETGFISNSKEEKMLRSQKFQKDMAMALRAGIQNYYREHPEYG